MTSIQALHEQEVDEAYRRGYDEGYDEGREDGYNDGYEDGSAVPLA